ncbi:molybdopterin-containing oxidoreductase family iron-sulfur binding subunit [Haloferula luteola]|uniref:Molybdopterin-containing oxidoreductase family iron-sulfur binding subunit n=1 Tax=Haloferula luteola TaxID=595692 RepID=A0A840VJ34_9BACT|nr:TAT-variant-translocated molybdopterin oxidoreductase [Haloferula luteola]MBB5353799.1 molybdopterin-containing oxidoreductase family iron-sulfur binding subunit [Haloferula luteola]
MSKRIWQHPDVPANESTVSWRGVGQLENTPEFREWLEREFPAGAAEMSGEGEMETTRRSFLKLMGASTALAGFGMAACRRPESFILPYANAPEWIIPGKATYYASSFPAASGATPLVVTTFEGRPTKVAPNTLHPDQSGTDAFVQASVLDLYSPSRSRKVLHHGKPASRGDFDTLLAGLAKDSGSKLGLVFGHDDSPTRARLLKDLQAKFSGLKGYAYEALEGPGQGAFGDGVRFVADFSKADRIVSLDCDFTGLDPVGPIGAFFDRRKPEGKAYDKKASAASMNRLYAVESVFSVTGGIADHRLRVKPSELVAVAAELLRALGDSGSVGNAPAGSAKVTEWVAEMAKDLQASRGRAVVLAGSRAPEAVHRMAAAINARIGALGEGGPLRAVATEATGLGSLADLIADLNSGAVEHVLFFTPSNPSYDAPVDLQFGEALVKAKTSIHFGLRTDATAHAATWHVPASHYLENWGDARTANGVYTIVQPMIFPLYEDSASELEVLCALLDSEGTLITGEAPEDAPNPAMVAVRKTFEGLAGTTEEAWKKLLRDGFLAGSSYSAATVAADAGTLSAAIAAAPQGGDYEVIFAADHSVYDGRWIDNGWLQEAPDPLCKLSWDNAALVSPQTAKELGIYDELVPVQSPTAAIPPDGEGEHKKGKLIRLKVGDTTIEIVAQIGFGQADGTIYVPVGYGQGFNSDDELGRDTSKEAHVGLVGVNTGFDVYPLRTSATPYFAVLAEAPSVTGVSYKLSATQEHHGMYGRAIAREISTADDEKKGDFAAQLADVRKQGMDSHAPPNVSLYKPLDRDGNQLLSDPIHQWAMAIDLSACTGCNACLIACQAENNIPIVGKEQLAKGREMHWIRMDRYFAQQKEDEAGDFLEMVPQPVACVQCEAAPCETVCPVNATVHTEDGLNAMAYNRCIGTRYCANNCPYKARRFNFFDYNKRNPLVAHNLYHGPFGEKQVGTSAHLQRNPNVSVRMRGVMEKCTYCVQRLKDAKIRQKRDQKQETLAAGNSLDVSMNSEKLRVPIDSVKVACQEACSAEAISFGNLLDGDKGRVGRVKALERNYDLLNYIGTRPRTSYIARVKNPNPSMPGAQFIGKATIHMH